MRTVSTKIDNTLHDEFLNACNLEGKCQSEYLRELIGMATKAMKDEEDMKERKVD